MKTRICANLLAGISEPRILANKLALISVFVVLFSSFSLVYASITLRVVAVNPSEEINQSVPIKVYLPLEVKPEDIIYKGDLEIAYDTQQGSYYMFGEYDLKPLEVLEKEVEIKDVWVIEDSQIIALRKEAKETFIVFEKTAYAEKAAMLAKNVEKKLKEIEGVQKVSIANPTQHISDYRYCLTLLNSANSDLVVAKALLAEIGPKGAAKLTWKIIIFIIVFLGILGLGFYVIWQRQAKIEAEQKT